MSTIIDFNDIESRLFDLESGGVIAETFTTNSYYKTYELGVNKNFYDTFIVGSNTTLKTGSWSEGTIIGGNRCILTPINASNNHNTCIFGRQFTYSSEYRTWCGGTFIVGDNSNFSATSSDKGSIITAICGYDATFSNMVTGVLICGNKLTLNNSTSANIISGPDTTISNTTYSNLIVGDGSKIALHNNVIAGGYTIIDENRTTQSGTSIIAFLEGDHKLEDYITNRYGLTLVGTYSTPYNWNDYRYRIYFPDSTNYPAQLYGAIQYTDSMNVLDKDDNVIISNGKLNGHLLTDEEYELFQRMKELLNN